MKGFGTDEAVLVRILSKPDPLQMALLRNTYSQRIKRNLEHDVESETSSHFKEGLGALVRGPLGQDVSEIGDGMLFQYSDPFARFLTSKKQSKASARRSQSSTTSSSAAPMPT